MADRAQAPWLVAVWPGMGNVAVLAGTYLLEALRAEPVGEVPSRDFFDLEAVEVRRGLVLPARYPHSTLYSCRNPDGPDLLVFVGEAQPRVRGYALCQELIDRAVDLGARRAATFAAMATPSDPRAPSRVFAAATEASLLRAVGIGRVHLLDEGAISGLNGVLLAAAQERGLPGVCLLGEFPYFASSIPQPKAAAAALRTFAHLTGVRLDLTELDEQAALLEERLAELLAELLEEAGADEELEEPAETEEEEEALDPAVVAQIEALFVQAERDRGKAVQLKSVLDQQGVFKEYEDRFLDLFKRGE